ncbi:ribonuclease P protein component [Nocardioides sp.]|uniref:ribonuclease P protein component n=1 Tax=Nocardioides sp. TaxID=35761 RepID=UPI0027346E30|nr:ribonuclease P protein component [Nocardioides sp.]MDP3893394.1 ribonuclease P protein component [Nocardioides sp.]
MLPAVHRLTDSEGFRTAVRSGRRAGSRTLVVHLASAAADAPDAAEPQVGFVVSRAVGNAVLRNRVKRRLRHLAREHVTSLPGSAVLVIRALPAAAEASYAELGADLRRALAKATGASRDPQAAPQAPPGAHPEARA